MAVPGLITISNPQKRVKDSYASSPKIDLTVRANGEERVMVMDSQGSWTIAGFDSPSVAATVNTSATAGSFTAARYWVYSYVYVAKRKYPLVENAQTGGGSPAPRSNPAPMAAANSVANTNQKILSIPTSSRNDLTHIWIYRTLLDFTTATEAMDNGLAGVMFWIGEIENNQNLTSVPFTDPGTDKTGQEQIENDNFSAPLFDKVVYADPYFWGFGNSIWYAPVTIDATGRVSNDIGTYNDIWFDGRNGQTITLDGITSGGYDNHGSFYFKVIDNLSGQLYSDLALQNPVGVSQIGSTKAMIRGASTVLYRSKPRNPFSWGYTDLIGDVQVPSLYNFPVGGAEGTGLAIIANQNLLKLDTERPTRCYTLNLKNAGTPNFEPSLRVISDTFSVSHPETQFTAVLERGQTVLRSLDMKTRSIIDCDGASQIPVSSPVTHTLRMMSGNSDPNVNLPLTPYPSLGKKSSLPHGVYVPKYELNCMFILDSQAQTAGVVPLMKMIYQHAPTGYWGTVDLFDVCCSAQIYDDFTSSVRVYVGTTTGFVGELFADNKWCQWFNPAANDQFPNNRTKGYGACTILNDGFGTMTIPIGTFTLSTGNLTPLTGLIGNWITLVKTDVNGNTLRSLYQVGAITGARSLTFIRQAMPIEGNSTEWNASGGTGGPSIPAAGDYTFFIGLIPMEIGRSFNGQIPFDYKKIEELHTAWRGTPQVNPPTIQFYGTFLPSYSAGSNEMVMTASNNSEGVTPSGGNFAILTNIPVDLAKSFGIIIRDRNLSESQLMSYEIRLSSTDGNNRQSNS